MATGGKDEVPKGEGKKGCCHTFCRNWPVAHLLSFLVILIGFIIIVVEVENVIVGLRTMGFDLRRFKNEVYIGAIVMLAVDLFITLVAFVTTAHCREILCHKTDNACVKGCQCLFGQIVQVIFILAVIGAIAISFSLCTISSVLMVVSGLTDSSCNFQYEQPLVHLLNSTDGGAAGNSTVLVKGENLIGPMFENAKSLLPPILSDFDFTTTGYIVCGENTSFVYWANHPEWKYDPGQDFYDAARLCFIGSTMMLFGQIFLLVAVVITYKNVTWEQAMDRRAERRASLTSKTDLNAGQPIPPDPVQPAEPEPTEPAQPGEPASPGEPESVPLVVRSDTGTSNDAAGTSNDAAVTANV